MRIGLITPVLTRVPHAHNAWEADHGIETVARIARAADELGFHHLTCSEHIAIPADSAAGRGTTYWDPLASFGYLAAHTSTIRFATQVLVLGYHHPLALAKRYGTLDAISNGRLILGFGVGSLREEFDLLGADFEGRGARGDDALRALRKAAGSSVPEYHGTHYDFSGMTLEPTLRADVPFWVGGRSRRSLRRALELGTGWVPFGLSLAELKAMLTSASLPQGFEVVLASGPLDPLGNPDTVQERLARLTATGATIVSACLTAENPDHYLEQLAALASLTDLHYPRANVGV